MNGDDKEKKKKKMMMVMVVVVVVVDPLLGNIPCLHFVLSQ